MNEGYNQEEIERIKKIIEIGKFQKNTKQSFWNEVNTPKVLRLKEESNTLRNDYYIIYDKLYKKISMHNIGLTSNDPEYISTSVRFYRATQLNLPDDIQELILISQEKWGQI